MSDSYFLVLPSLPSDGLQLYPATNSLNFGYQQQACVGLGGNQWLGATPSPHSFFTSSDKAHTEAQRLSKLHQSPYYVAQVNIMGQYIPPPPEWKPTYEQTWKKP